ncbi:hypothetical protein TNCV_4695471 [Trichonephila clavipes]|nr:hypothetical protein TNCV_4695471 [Trichonephila clavipes]
MNMNRYTNTELAIIYFIYGLGNGNGHVAVRLCGETYPMRRQLNHQTFTWVHQNVASFRVMTDNMPINSEIDLGDYRDSVQYNSVDDETDENEDNNNESSKGSSNADAFFALETAMKWNEQQSELFPTTDAQENQRPCR